MRCAGTWVRRVRAGRVWGAGGPLCWGAYGGWRLGRRRHCLSGRSLVVAGGGDGVGRAAWWRWGSRVRPGGSAVDRPSECDAC